MTRTGRRAGTALILSLAFLLARPASLVAEGTESPTGSGEGQPAASSPVVASPAALPQGFAAPEENFFRRFEIIAFGSLPITLLYTNIGFQLYHFMDNGFDMSWAPWPFEGANTDSITDSERFTRIGIAAGAAVAVAGVDALIRYLQARKTERLAAARKALLSDEGQAPSPAASAPSDDTLSGGHSSP